MSGMLILLTVALATVTCSGGSVHSTTLASDSSSIKTKRGIVETGHGVEDNPGIHRSGPVKARQSNGSPVQGTEDKSVALKILNSLDKNVPFPGMKYGSGGRNAPEYQQSGVSSAQFARTSSPSYVLPPTLVHQVGSQANYATPYFNAFNPGNYKIVADGTKPVAQIKSIGPGISSFGDVGYSLLSGFPLHGNQAQPLTQEEQTSGYKTSYPGLKNGEFSSLYAPSFQRASNSLPAIQTSEKVTQTPASLNENERKVSVPLHLRQSNADPSAYLQIFEKQPLLLGTRFQYHADPIQGYNFGQARLTAAPQSSGAPFLSAVPNFQGQVVPIQTTNGNKQFPQYRGAAVGVYPVSNNVGQVPGLYQPLHTQPQLHFGSVQAVNAVNSKPSEEIRTDVEIITKRPPPPPSPHHDDDDSDDGYKDIEKEYGRESEENYDNAGGPEKHFNGAKYQSDFKPSKTFPFKAYDEKFGRHSQQNNNEDSEEKPHSNYQDYHSSDDDDDRRYKSPSSKYHSDYSSSEPYYEKYEDDEEEEEESQKYEKQHHDDEDDSKYEPQRYKYGKHAEDSYKRELQKSRNDGVKEDEYGGDSRRRERSQRRGNREGSENSRYKFRDNEGHSTNITPRKAPRVVYEEFFGANGPKSQKYEKEVKDGVVSEKYVLSEKSPKKDSFFSAMKSSYKLKEPKSEDDSKYEKGQSYAYASSSRRNSKENSPEDYGGFSSSVASEMAHASDDHDSFYRPTLVSAKVRPLTTAEVLRDLTGI